MTRNSTIRPVSSHVMMSTPFTYFPSTLVSNSSTAVPGEDLLRVLEGPTAQRPGRRLEVLR